MDEAGGDVGGGEPRRARRRRGPAAAPARRRRCFVAEQMAQAIFGERPDIVGLVEKARRWKVPIRIWPWLRRTSTAERVGEGSSLRSSASPVSISEKVFEVSTPSASSISVASTSRIAALEGEPAVAEAAVGRLARALGAEVEQPSGAVAQLGEQEAAAVADVGIVHAELVAVIAQRQRLRSGCPAAARSGRNGGSTLRRPACRGRPRPPSGRCGSEATVWGKSAASTGS